MAKKTKKERTQKEKAEEFKVEVKQTVNDVKSFIKNFKSAVNQKRKGYKLYAQKFKKKK